MPERRTPRSVPTRRGTVVAALTALVLLLALAGCGGSGEPTGRTGLHGNALDQPYRVDGTPLTDTDGKSFSLAGDTEAPLTLVFFGYTHCPDICQMVMSTIAAAKLRLPEQQRDDVDVVMVTTDPARDDEATLRRYLDRFDPAFQGATGELPEIKRIARSVAVFIGRGDRLPSGGYEVAHNDHVVAITPDDRVHTLWTRDVSAADLGADLETLLSRRGSSS